MSRYHSGQQVSQYIILVGVLIIVASMLWVASNYLGDVKLPEDYRQNVTGSSQEITSSMGRLVNRCWEQANHGRGDDYIDCYLVQIDTSDTITKADLLPVVKRIPPDRLDLVQPITPSTNQLRVRYRPDTGNISIT